MDEFLRLAGDWTLDFCQLDTGASTGEYMHLAGPGIGLERFEFSRGYAKHGETPPGMRTFGILEREVDCVSCCGSSMSAQSIFAFPANREFEATSGPGFSAYSLSVSEEVLEQTAELIGAREFGRLIEPGLHQLDPTAMQGLRGELRSLRSAVRENPQLSGTHEIKERLRFEIPRLLLETLASGRVEESPVPDSRSRQTALKRARVLLEDITDEPVTIREVCQATGMSWRTLNYAFREYFGISPKTYLTAIRLHRVRTHLLRPDPSTTVAHVANRQGFWHMGQFAAD
ncbi:MAG: helix-turn-helix domain-containing protein, partial [bacterium]|nr:helix-turn-helix domain-containing protein [bacterium]